MVTCSLYWTYTWSPNLVLFRSHTWKPVKLGSVSVLHLKASQTWFRSILTLESQSNLVLFRSYTWKSIKLGSNFAICLLTWTYSSLLVLLRIPAYLDLPLITSLVALWLYHACLLDWTYTFDAELVRIWKIFENSDLFELTSFSSKVFLKILSGVRPFFNSHSCFR